MVETIHVTDIGVDELPCGCVVMNSSRRITFANKYIALAFGWDQHRTKDLGMEMLMSKASHLFCESYVYPMLAQDGKCNEIQLTLVSPAGTRIPAIVNVKRLRNDRVVWSIFVAENRDKLQHELVAARNRLEEQALELKKQSTTDHLTGLKNRRALNAFAETTFCDAAKSGDPITVLIIDIDDFKSINDTYGHNFGDDVLRKVGASLAATCRSTEFVARFGGEEFVFILNTDASGSSVDFANRVHAAIEDGLKHFLPITVSIGVAARFGRFGPSYIELLGQADKALFEAKRTGKNRTIVGGTVKMDYSNKAT